MYLDYIAQQKALQPEFDNYMNHLASCQNGCHGKNGKFCCEGKRLKEEYDRKCKQQLYRQS